MHIKHSKICSDHFITGKPAVLYDETNPDWAPSVHLGYANGTHTCTTDRYNRMAERKKRNEVYDAAQALLNLSSQVQEENVASKDISAVSDNSCQVKCKFYLMGKLENNFGSSHDEKISKLTMDELNRLILENFELRQQKSANEVTEETFIGNDEKVKYYTGLPTSSILMAVYKLVEAYINDSTKCSLSKFHFCHRHGEDVLLISSLQKICGFLNKLNPGHIVLADRGFNIKECVGLRGAEAKIPAFIRGKRQMSPLELETSRKIAHLRIHKERVIGQLRNKYTLLQDTLPIDYVISSEDDIPVIDKIATVCCALINLCESVVPFN